METVRRPEPNRLRTLFWADLNDEVETHDAARNGYYACLFIATSALVLSLVNGVLLGGLVDVCFFLMAGFGVRQLSRLASVATFIYYLFEKAVALLAGQVGFFSFVGILLAAILFNAVRAAYAARELRPAGDLDQIFNPGFVTANALARYLETLPPALWPQLRMPFRFYLVGLIAMMIVGFIVERAGLLQQ